jgi:hypothetical protein
MTRGWACNLLELLLQFGVTLGSKSCRTRNQNCLSRSTFPQPGGLGPRIYIPQGQGDPVAAPGTRFSFVANYNSRGYDGGRLIRLQEGELTVVSIRCHGDVQPCPWKCVLTARIDGNGYLWRGLLSTHCLTTGVSQYCPHCYSLV